MSSLETRVNKILVPMDGSENSFRAASFAVDMAHRYKSELILAYAIEIIPILSTIGLGEVGLSSAQFMEKLKEAARKEADQWFARVQGEAEFPNVLVRTEVIEAPSSLVSDIIGYAEKIGIDLIIMGSRGRTGFKKLLLGSVASGIVTYARCPVMVVK
jgi:nucleotide-binding universal stress UspA family protein